jgi:hypothetical protein
MKSVYLIIILGIMLGINYCNPVTDQESPNMKDLDENMIDVRVYHENLGGDLSSGDIDGAKWLLTGMDSILQVISIKFTTHRKLDKPFSYYYDKNLKPSIQNMQSALAENDLPGARSAYTILTKKCNGCHQDHDVDKEVQNWLRK